MTPLKPNEKKLLIAFGIGGFVLLNLLGWSWYSNKMLLLDREATMLKAREKDLTFWKTQAGEAERLNGWISQHLTAYQNETVRETELDNFVQKQARDLGLELRKNAPQEAKFEEHFIKSRYTAEVSGTWPSVSEFIYRLQKPEDFRFAPRVMLSSKRNDKSESGAEVVFSFDLEKWWSPESAAIAAEAAEATGAPPETEKESEQSAAPDVSQSKETAASPAPTPAPAAP